MKICLPSSGDEEGKSVKSQAVLYVDSDRLQLISPISEFVEVAISMVDGQIMSSVTIWTFNNQKQWVNKSMKEAVTTHAVPYNDRNSDISQYR